MNNVDFSCPQHFCCLRCNFRLVPAYVNYNNSETTRPSNDVDAIRLKNKILYLLQNIKIIKSVHLYKNCMAFHFQ